jgi:hypothetical protein
MGPQVQLLSILIDTASIRAESTAVLKGNRFAFRAVPIVAISTLVPSCQHNGWQTRSGVTSMASRILILDGQHNHAI